MKIPDDLFLYGEWANIPIMAQESWAGKFMTPVLKDVHGCIFKILMFYKDNKEEVMFISKSSNDEIAASFKKIYEKDSKAFHKAMDNYTKKRKEIFKRWDEIDNMDLSKLSNKELEELFWETRKIISYSGAHDWYSFSFDNKILDVVGLENYFKKHPNEKQEILSLTQPDAILQTLEEEIEVLKLAKKAQGMNKEEILRKFKSELEKLSKEYGWIAAFILYPFKSVKDYAEQVEEHANDAELDTELEEKSTFVYNNKKKFKKFIDEKNPPQKVINAIEAIQKLSEIRAVGEMDAIHGFTFCRKLDAEIQKRNSISADDYNSMYMDEIAGLISTGKKLESDDMKNRKVMEGMMMGDDGNFFRVENPLEVYEKLKSQEKDSTELKGMPGCAGKVTGKVHLIHSSQDVDKFKEGEILVAKATCVDYVVIMKKAGAIVTQFGGVTSHAAVVSRELGVPSIIGIPKVTELLKDGDLIEVDANKGIVKKLE